MTSPTQRAGADVEVPCSTHPDAPHGFDRNGSHNADRYVCECEGWLPDEWRCFHCDAVFTTRDEAAEHFGTREHHSPACQIDVAEYRRMEAMGERYAEEDAECHRALYRAQSDHQQALRRAEEDGYAKGLKDYAALQARIAELEARNAASERALQAVRDECEEWNAKARAEGYGGGHTRAKDILGIIDAHAQGQNNTQGEP